MAMQVPSGGHVHSIEAVITKKCGCVIDHGVLAHTHPHLLDPALQFIGTVLGHKPKIVARCDGSNCAISGPDAHPDDHISHYDNQTGIVHPSEVP